jgi:hypothetical protein
MEASVSNVQNLNTEVERSWSDGSSSDGSNTPTN